MFGIPINANKKKLEQALVRAEKALKENPNSDIHKMLAKTIKQKLSEITKDS